MEEVVTTNYESSMADEIRGMNQSQKNMLGGETYRFVRRMLRDPEVRAKVNEMTQRKDCKSAT